MGMPITIELADPNAEEQYIDDVIMYLRYIDETFSTYKNTSEISRINSGLLDSKEMSADMREVFDLSEETKQLTNGFFDIRRPQGGFDPSGLVKGLAIYRSAEILRGHGLKNFYVDIAGDIQADGCNAKNEPWVIGIRNPFAQNEIIKVLSLSGRGIATSGTYIRGPHIYNPHAPDAGLNEIVSLTVVGPNVYEADRFATAAFAMGKDGITFIAALPGFEGYMIDRVGMATATDGFADYVK